MQKRFSKTLAVFFLMWSGSVGVYADESFVSKVVQIDGAPVYVTSGTSSSGFMALADCAGYPSPGRIVPEMTSADCCGFAANANFYREDVATQQIPIGLVVHSGRVYTPASARWPSIGMFSDQSIVSDVVTTELNFEFDRDGTILKMPVCGWTTKINSKKCLRMSNGLTQSLPGISYFGISENSIKTGVTPLLLVNSPHRGVVVQVPKSALSKQLNSFSSPRLNLTLTGKKYGTRWSSVIEAVSGSNYFNADGSTVGSAADWTRARQPRTFAGLTKSGRFVISVFDGRTEKSHGVSLGAGWDFLRKNYGLSWAVSLDGGGSATFIKNGRIVSRPSDGFARPIPVGVASECAAKCRSESNQCKENRSLR